MNQAEAALSSSLASAVEFLLAGQNWRGWWRDFPGHANEWVTAFTAVTLALLPEPSCRAAALRAWKRLRRRRWWLPGWGFKGTVPPDADSTTWTLLLAEALNDHSHRRVRRASQFLLRHLRADNGIATYASSGAIRAYTRLINPRITFDGWCQSHVSVTAAAAHLRALPVREDLLAYLRAMQAPDGSWSAYWWRDREYATALAASALQKSGTVDDRARVERAVDWAMTRFGPDGAIVSDLHPEGSAFATALAVRILTLAAEWDRVSEVIGKALDWLLSIQADDGSWPASARLRMPMPHIIDPDAFDDWLVEQTFGGNRIVYDQRRIFTTATVVDALRCVTAARS